jgi:hypothetical protein
MQALANLFWVLLVGHDIDFSFHILRNVRLFTHHQLEPAAPPAPKDIKARLEPVPSSADFVHTRKVYLIFAIPPPVPQGCIVRYTLDGSEPKPGNANSFVAPLTVKAARLKSTAIVKWVVEDGRGGRMGPVEERNYKVER